MHIGSFDDEPQTVSLMHEFMVENGYKLDITENRYHHEIYLSDPRKCAVEKYGERAIFDKKRFDDENNIG